MPHIDLPELPGIVGLLVQYPQTAGPLNALADALLRGPSPLTPAERETIAAYVSSRNDCTFCAETHGAVARHLHGSAAAPRDASPPADPVGDVLRNGERADVGPRMRALLAIADKVRVDARSVGAADVDRAREAGADDRAIHDTVLIAAAFCMYNRYVDGLATVTPEAPQVYTEHARRLVRDGYLAGPA